MSGCRTFIHTVGPCVFGNLSKKDEEELADCYKSCLNLAKEMNLKSIAFCCISTGEFRFPKERACEIATQTVKDWLAKSNYYINVVFDVFEDEDRDLYLKKLNF